MANVMESVSNIYEFYKGKTIFITGGTGFVGKVLVEKLLRSCGGLKRIYLLVRPKKGVEPRERMEQLFESKALLTLLRELDTRFPQLSAVRGNDVLFDRLRKERPNFWNQVSCICGDLESEDLGMSIEDHDILSGEVSIIFHVGANVRFDDLLKSTLSRNLLGTKRIIDLAKKIKDLKALVHVSTAYCNTHHQDIYEAVYPTDFPAMSIIDCLSWMSEDLMENMKPILLSRHPNNYCYSKCLAEQLLTEEAGNLPVAIVRPTIVVSTYKEPMEGWIDVYNGITMSFVAISKGLLRTAFSPKQTMDYIPVDYCVNLILASAWHVSKKGAGNMDVYNCSTTTVNRSCTKQRWKALWELPIRYPSLKAYRYPSMSFTTNKLWSEINHFYLHFLPAVIVDVYLFLSGNKPSMLTQYKKMRVLEKQTAFFAANDWNFHSENFKTILKEMTDADKKTFDFDVRNIDWNKYIEIFVPQIRKYLLKEDPQTLPLARRRLQRLYYIDLAVHAVIIGGILYVLPFGVWDTLMGFLYEIGSIIFSLTKSLISR